MSKTRWGWCAALGLVALNTPSVFAQRVAEMVQPAPAGKDKQPAPPAPAAAPEAKAADAKGEGLLASARDAIGKLTRVSYTGRSFVDGTRSAPVYAAEVQAAKAEAGGWKVAAKGSATSGKDGDTGTPFHVGYDGADAWSIKDADKTALQKAATDEARVMQFFREQSAGHVVAWEILAEKALAFDGWRADSCEASDVDGVRCDVVVLRRQAGNPAAGDDDTDSEIRLHFAEADKLPRRVDRIRETPAQGDAAPKRLTRTLVLKGLRTEEKAMPGAFTLAAPEGYRVREVTDRPVRKEASKPPSTPGGKKGAGGQRLVPHDPELLAVGSKAPEFTLKNPKGEDVSLSSFKGKVVVIDFWGSWCPPCRAAMPGIQKLHEKYKDKPVVVLGLNNERRPDADPAKFMKQNGYTYPILLNAEKVAPKYKLPGWPTFYVISPEGKILWGACGNAPGHDETIAHYVDEELKKLGGAAKEGEAPKEEKK